MFKILEESKGLDLNGCTLKYVDRGLGYRCGDVIFLNEKLKDYPMLRDTILLHELGHSSKFNFFDIVNDLNPRQLSWDWWRFVLKHRSSWWHFCPFIKLDRKYRFQAMLFFYYFVFLIFCFYIVTKGIVLWRIIS